MFPIQPPVPPKRPSAQKLLNLSINPINPSASNSSTSSPPPLSPVPPNEASRLFFSPSHRLNSFSSSSSSSSSSTSSHPSYPIASASPQETTQFLYTKVSSPAKNSQESRGRKVPIVVKRRDIILEGFEINNVLSDRKGKEGEEEEEEEEQVFDGDLERVKARKAAKEGERFSSSRRSPSSSSSPSVTPSSKLSSSSSSLSSSPGSSVTVSKTSSSSSSPSSHSRADSSEIGWEDELDREYAPKFKPEPLPSPHMQSAVEKRLTTTVTSFTHILSNIEDHAVFASFSASCDQISILQALSKQTNIKPVQIANMTLLAILAYMVGILKFNFVFQVLVFYYPAYSSYKALEAGGEDAKILHQWLIYWCIYAIVRLIENTIDWCLLLIPGYVLFKYVFLIWCFHPATKGGIILYDELILPIFSHYESTLDARINQALQLSVGFVKEVINFCREQVTGYIATKMLRSS